MAPHSSGDPGCTTLPLSCDLDSFHGSHPSVLVYGLPPLFTIQSCVLIRRSIHNLLAGQLLAGSQAVQAQPTPNLPYRFSPSHQLLPSVLALTSHVYPPLTQPTHAFTRYVRIHLSIIFTTVHLSTSLSIHPASRFSICPV